MRMVESLTAVFLTNQLDVAALQELRKGDSCRDPYMG